MIELAPIATLLCLRLGATQVRVELPTKMLNRTDALGRARSFDSTETFPGDGAHALGAEGVHDPTIIELGGRYYCFCTSGNSFTVIRSSTDLTSWKVEGPIFGESPKWLEPRFHHRSIWAPDVVVLGRSLRMYYCASDFGTNRSVIGMSECPDFDLSHPTRGWVDRGLIIESNPGKEAFNAIDPEVLIDADGKQWMFFGSYFGGIYVASLDAASGKIADSPKLVARNTSEKGNPLEGAAVKQRGKYYYLFVSYGLAAQGVRSTYRIMVGRSESPSGPFFDAEGIDMVDGGHLNVLKTSPPMFSPGHCDVLQLHDGRWVMPYHFYDGRKFWHGDLWGLPTMQIRELLWSADGWPLPGLPIESGAGSSIAPKSSPIGKWTHQADFGAPLQIELKQDGSIAGGLTAGRWRLDQDELVLEWAKADDPKQFWIDRVALYYGGAYYVGRNRGGMVIRGARSER